MQLFFWSMFLKFLQVCSLLRHPEGFSPRTLLLMPNENKKSPNAYFCDIINSRKSEFSQTGMTYTNSCIYVKNLL